jgi:transcriptional regulator with PAS, ATPase and Fis domain
MRHDYPGNIRELENAIEHAFVLCREGSIQPGHLPEQFTIGGPGKPVVYARSLRDIEIAAIYEALRRNNNNRTAAAHDLGIHKSTLHRKIRAYRLTDAE